MSITDGAAPRSTRGLDVAYVIRDGGGTAPVELTVAAKLRERGHRVRVFGPPEVCEHTTAAGFDLVPLEQPSRPGPPAGVPLVCVPMGRDQPAVAARVTRHGLGVRVQPDAGVDELRSAIDGVLREPAYRRAARRMAAAIEPAGVVIDETEALAAARAR